MSATSNATQQTATAWTAIPAGLDNVRPGTVAPVRRIAVSDERIDRIGAALHGVLGPSDTAASVADLCPDPLVFALESGLPRLVTVGRAIDGGSAWGDHAAVEGDSVFAVSSIDEVAERTTSDGRRLVRVTYLTRFTDDRGALIGTASGISMHVGSDS